MVLNRPQECPMDRDVELLCGVWKSVRAEVKQEVFSDLNRAFPGRCFCRVDESGSEW